MALRRSQARAWVPALTAAVVLVGLLFAMWALNKASFGGDSAPSSPDAPLWRWLLETNNAFWGPTPFATGGGGRILAATVASAIVIFLVGYVLTWRAVAGLRPGSSAWTAFLSTWAALTIASVLGAITAWLIATRDISFRGAGQAQFAVLTNGLQYGAKYGWIASLLGTLLWMLVRVDEAEALRQQSGQLGPPSPYPSERESYFRTHDRGKGREVAAPPAPLGLHTGGAAADDVEEPSEADIAAANAEAARLAALRAQVEAEAEAESAAPAAAHDPLEPRPNPTPTSLLDQHRQAPAPAFTREPEPEPTAPYVGRRARAAYDPSSDVPDGSPSAPGSHRAPRDQD